MPPPENAFLDAAAQLQQQLDIGDIWRSTAGKSSSLNELGDLAQAAAAKKNLKADLAACRLAVMRLILENPVYFRRRGNGSLVPLPAEFMQKALAAQRQTEQKKECENEILRRLSAGETPPEVTADAEGLMYAPDKNAPAYRALKKHLNGDGAEFARFFINRGVLTDVRAYWRQMFYHIWNTPATPTVEANEVTPPPLKKAAAAAFSIDDENTVEVDDAFSVEDEDGGWRVGIHIAAPALTLSATADATARQRLLSVYFPDEKHTMLPPACVKACSLALNADRAAVSLYLHCSADGDKWRVGETVLQQVRLNAQLTPAQMDAGEAPPTVAAAFEKLKRLCRHMDCDGCHRGGANTADFKIVTSPPGISRRIRGDAATVVEALMRTVNSVWAARLAAAADGGLYRRDGATRTAPPRREAPYMWLSSPLRRYVDLANQRVLLSLLAATAPPQEDWRGLAAAFEKRHRQAKHFQRLIERHWALRILSGETAPLVGRHDGKGRVILRDYPLTGKWQNNTTPAGEVHARVGAIDFLKQSVSLVTA